MLASSATDAAGTTYTPGALSQLSPDADWQAIADRLYAANCALVAQTEALERSLQEKQQESDVRAVRLLALEEAQATKVAEAETALQACQARDREQLRAIATLSERLEISQVRAEQLERECLALQATCREQTERTTCAQKEIQELHARLQQQQQQTARAQDALERHLAELTANSNRSNAWPPPIIAASDGGDRAATKVAVTAIAAEEVAGEAATTIVVSVDSQPDARQDDPAIEDALGMDANGIDMDNGADEGDSLPEFPFDAILNPEAEPLSETDWIAPLVQPLPLRKKHKTLATILLPEF